MQKIYTKNLLHIIIWRTMEIHGMVDGGIDKDLLKVLRCWKINMEILHTILTIPREAMLIVE